MADKITVMVREPGLRSRWEPRVVENTLEAFQQLVGGWIETITVCRGLVLIVNEEGVLKNLPENIYACGHWLRGTVVAAGVKGDDFADCPMGSDWQMRIAIGVESARASRKGTEDDA